MPHRKRSHRPRSPSRNHDRSPSESPSKRQKTPSQDENLWIPSYKLCSSCKPKWRRQVNEFLRSNLSSRSFAPSHLDDQISILAYSDGGLLDYSQDEVSLDAGLQDRVKPNYKAIKPSHTATRPSHETSVSQTPEEPQPNGQASNNFATNSSSYDPDSTKWSWEPQKELSAF